jgi:hypothetical protein
MVVVVMVEGIVFFEEKRFVRDRFEGESLILIVVVVVVERIMFFEGKGFVRGRSKDESLILVIVVVEGIVFAVFSSENMRNLIISITVNLTNSIISFLITSGRYKS